MEGEMDGEVGVNRKWGEDEIVGEKDRDSRDM